ncbi:phage major capsid protein [Alteribacillus sp. YIM 98480]|uniref:phage major capsid protein n=1 Tax=Alteribacillus sp. YIM 98480 TaxID=2606599 RepID=UPI00131E84AF
MQEILEMKQKRAALVKEARGILDKAKGEKRDLTAEEEQQYDRIMADVDKRGKQIQREEQMAGIENELEQRGGRQTHQDPNAETGKQEQRNVHPRATEEYRSAFWRAQRAGRNALSAEQYDQLMHPEVRSLAVGTDSAGGYTVPDEFERQLVQELEDRNIMRGLATVISTSSGSREIPVEADKGSASWLDEEASYSESDAEFAQKVIGAHKLGRIMKVSEELLNDSAFNIESYVRNAFARSFAEAEEAAFVNGDGTGKPTGLFRDAETGPTAAGTDSITTDELIDLFHSLRRPYRRRATWMMADSTAKAIRKLKDANDQYIWQPGLQAGQADRILGRPLAISDNSPSMDTDNTPIAFGDYSYYWIADRQGRVMQRLDELYAANGQIGFRLRQRVDGKLILTEAVKLLKMASA